MFSYVNELNDELEGLQIRVSQLRDDIDEARALNARRGFQQAETLEKIAKELEEQEKKANDAEENLVKVVIIHLFNQLNYYCYGFKLLNLFFYFFSAMK